MATITVTNLHQAGRSTAPDAKSPRISYNYNADFSQPSDIEFDLTLVDQLNIFGIIRSLFVDNGSSPSPIEVSVSGTDQFFTVPAYAQGNFVINAADKSKIRMVTEGGASDQVTVTIYNYEVSPCVWYSYGTINFNLVLPTQGSMAEGTDVATDPANAPLYIGGIDRDTGQFRGISVDAIGRLGVNIENSPTVSVSGPIDVGQILNDVNVNIVNTVALQGAYVATGIVTLAGTSEALFGANPARRVLFVNNPNTTNPIGINLAGGVAAIGSAGTITILPGETFRIDNYPPNGIINVIGTATEIVTAYEG